MSENENRKPEADGPNHKPPPGAEMEATWSGNGSTLAYLAKGEWTVLRKRERPAAELFHVSYLAREADEHERPVTFVFNGGPGASSAYLHMGVAGPQRVAFPADGSLPRPPARLVANEDSWLAFTDLVFIDPIGTGFSRAIEKDGEPKETKPRETASVHPHEHDKDQEKEFFGLKRDLESLCEFISRWLSVNRRWGSPVLIAGESYGGYRVGRLARMLQETTGVGLNGAILISPALEIGALWPTDYDLDNWIDLLPTMALAAHHHGRSRAFDRDATLETVAAEAERFATGDYATLIARGASMPEQERRPILERLAQMIGLAEELVVRSGGRIKLGTFTRELLRDERKVLGAYDATITATDPFPDRELPEGPDPTLAGTSAAFTAAINRQLRSEIGVQSEREYTLLSEEANEAWRDDAPQHIFIPTAGATDDLRYGMALNPHMRTFIAHGRYDLVTPYHGSDRLRNLMRLDPETEGRLTVRHFGGGHMFYAWEESRREFSRALAGFYEAATA